MPGTGQQVSHYRILEKIGQGGMGEVYLADDLSLDRKVALKFLPDVFTGDPERMARFEREAKLLASLNHPNIAAIYGLEQDEGQRFLVLEYVKGETLQQRLSQGPLPLEGALAVCRQIAEALEAAHENGVIHRDLKPANVMITAENKVKILDFGLAKALADEIQNVESSHSPTITEAMTQPGVVLGTAAYMSPEQAKGKGVDRRADIWAFGCILYECLAGKKAYKGESVTETLAAVIKEDPDWDSLPEATPQNIQFVLRRCLEKERNRRFRDAADVQIEIEEARRTHETATPPRQRSSWLWKTVAGIFVVAFASVSFVHFREKAPTPQEPVRMQMAIADNLNTPWWTSMSLSPDGHWMAFSAPGPNSVEAVWIRAMDSFEARPLTGTESNRQRDLLFWSPDSRFIAFDADSKLKKINISSGLVKTISDLSFYPLGGCWNHDDKIILGVLGQGIMQVPAAGGDLAPLTILNQELQEQHISPIFLPDGRHFLYSYLSESSEKKGIYVGSCDSKPEENVARQVLADNFVFRYIPSRNSDSGHLLYLRENTLMAQLFDERSLGIIGEPFTVTEEVASSALGTLVTGNYTVSNNGVLAYQDMHSQVDSKINQELVWKDRKGKKISTVGPQGEYSNFRLSRDEKRIIFDRRDESDTAHVWLLDLIRGVSTKLTNDPSWDNLPIWSPDDLRVLFPSTREGLFNLYIKAASGAGQAELLVKMGTPTGWGTDWSQDERFILYQIPGEKSGQDLWIAPQSDDQKPYPYLQEDYDEQEGAFSPDGKWIAYVSSESGRNEIYVQSLPLSDKKFQISTDGGSEPYWSRDGTELFYIAADRNLMAVPVQVSPTFAPGLPKPMFPVPIRAEHHSYAASRDSKRFLIVNQANEEEADLAITVVVNWLEALNK